MRSRRTSRAAPAVMVVVAALGVWSCGGSYESPSAAIAIESGSDEDSAVTSSAATMITVCHKEKDLRIAAAALAGHLGHGDRLGSCTAVCPCFTSEGLADVAAQCPVDPIAACGVRYSINLFCAPGGDVGLPSHLGYFEARLGTDTCSTTTKDPTTGGRVTTTLPVLPEQFEACRQAIVESPYYPASCPD